MIKNKKIGNKGEYYTKKHLENQGLIFVTANFYTRSGEIDLIFRDQKYIYFIEVKTRQGHLFGYPEEAVTKDKLLKIKKTIISFLRTHPQYAGLTPVIQVAAVILSAADHTPKSIEIFASD